MGVLACLVGRSAQQVLHNCNSISVSLDDLSGCSVWVELEEAITFGLLWKN